MDTLEFEDFDNFLLQNKGKIIHQIWFGLIPNKREAKKAFIKLKKYRDSWIIHNPDLFYVCWDYNKCRQLIKNHFPEHLDMYQSYPYLIQKCDCVRYCILYRYGGLYADVDYFCNRSWNEVIEKYPDELYITETPNKINDCVHISNSLMYSKVGHPFWKHILIEMEKNRIMPIYYSRHLTIMYTTGPGIINRVFNKYKTKYSLDFYPYKLFHPFGINTDLHVINDPKIYAYHLQKGSWNTLDTNILNFLYKENKSILLIISILIIPTLICNIYLKKRI